MLKPKTILLFLAPLVLSLIMHLSIFRLDVMGYHSWRQAQTQTVVYNFGHADPNILHPTKFDLGSGSSLLLYEFPLYQYTAYLFNRCCGYDVMHTRVLSFLCLCCFAISMFLIVRSIYAVRTALMANAFLVFSPLLYYYCVNPLPDVMALAAASWAVYFFQKYQYQSKWHQWALACLMLVIAGLVKLPYFLFGSFALPIFRSRSLRRSVVMLLATLVFSLPLLYWYANAIPTWGTNEIAYGLLKNKVSAVDLADILFFNLVSSLPELLLNYAAVPVFITGAMKLWRSKKWSAQKQSWFVLLVTLCIYFLFDMNMIGKTHDYYLMPFVIPCFMIVAKGSDVLLQSKPVALYVLVALVPLLAWLRIQHRWDPSSPGLNSDYLEHGKEIAGLIPKNAKCIIDGDESKYIALYYLKRYGYSYSSGYMGTELLKERYRAGARYLVTENLNTTEGTYYEIKMQQIYAGKLKVFKFEPK